LDKTNISQYERFEINFLDAFLIEKAGQEQFVDQGKSIRLLFTPIQATAFLNDEHFNHAPASFNFGGSKITNSK